MIGAVLGLIGGRGIAIAAGALAAVALLFGVYQTGVSAERKRGEAATLRAQLAIVRADLAISRAAEVDAKARGDELASAAGKNKEAIDELEADLAKRPVADRCGLSGADARKLRNIR
jgi:hypothetical protein